MAAPSEESKPLIGVAEKVPRGWKNPWYAMLGDGSPQDVAACCVTWHAPFVAHGWNQQRGLGLVWWKEALKFLLLTGGVLLALHFAMCASMRAACGPPPPMPKDMPLSMVAPGQVPMNMAFGNMMGGASANTGATTTAAAAAALPFIPKGMPVDDMMLREDMPMDVADMPMNAADVHMGAADMPMDAADMPMRESMPWHHDQDGDDNDDDDNDDDRKPHRDHHEDEKDRDHDHKRGHDDEDDEDEDEEHERKHHHDKKKRHGRQAQEMMEVDETNDQWRGHHPWGKVMPDMDNDMPGPYMHGMMHQECMVRVMPMLAVLHIIGFIVIGCGIWMFASRRTQLRERFGIPGSFKEDCCLWTFCGPCALAQETRTLMHNNVHEGMWMGPQTVPPAPQMV